MATNFLPILVRMLKMYKYQYPSASVALGLCQRRFTAWGLAGAGTGSHQEIRQQRKSTETLRPGMACRLITKAPYIRRRVRPKLQGFRHAHNARQCRPRPRTCEPYQPLLHKSLCGMFHYLGRTDKVKGLSNLHVTFSVIDTMRPRACMSASQPGLIRTLL